MQCFADLELDVKYLVKVFLGLIYLCYTWAWHILMMYLCRGGQKVNEQQKQMKKLMLKKEKKIEYNVMNISLIEESWTLF